MMNTLKSDYLGTLSIELAASHMVGEIPRGRLRVDVFKGGSLEGPRIKARILAGGSDSLIGTADGAVRPDVRLTLETDDGALIYVHYRGVRHASSDVMQRLAREEAVDPGEYYLRNAPFFETASEKYDWLNRIVAVGIGRREPGRAVYDLFEIL